MRTLCINTITIIIFICIIIVVRSPRGGNLQQVYIIFRHGERTPTEAYRNDPYKDYPWPGGWDQLTIVGKRNMYHLGKQLRERYASFMEKYDTKLVRVESSYADRCLMSAQLLLAGLFPPQGDDIWNDALLWQPIPVHSLPRLLDNKIALKRPCKSFLRALNESYASLTDVNVENRQLYDYLAKHSGDEIRNIRTLESLYNTLEIEQLQGLTLPDWTEGVFPHKMRDLAAMSLAIFTHTTFMKRLHGGVLVADILNNIVTMNKKMILYSSHDLTIVSILRVLGFAKLVKPEFGASIFIEVYNEKEGAIIKFYYKDNPYSNPNEIRLDACGKEGCKLSDLHQLLKPVIPLNWEAECNAD